MEPRAAAPPTPTPARDRDPVSGALLLAVLGLFSFGILSAVGLLLGVRGLVRALRRSDARRTGTAVTAIAANLLVLYVSVTTLRVLLQPKPSTAEATAIGDIRTVIAAQAAYAALNDGRYEPRLDCLVEPATCLPDYPTDGPPFLDRRLAAPEPRVGYRRAFRPGPPAAPRPPLRGRPRPPGVVSFACTAVPERPGQTGVRGFCGDSTAVLCYTEDGREPGVTPNGTCDLATCRELR